MIHVFVFSQNLNKRRAKSMTYHKEAFVTTAKKNNEYFSQDEKKRGLKILLFRRY